DALPICARSMAAVERSLAGNRLVLLAARRGPERADIETEDLVRMGTVAMVLGSRRMPDGRLKVMVQGLRKARIDSVIEGPVRLPLRSRIRRPATGRSRPKPSCVRFVSVSKNCCP
ncbi:MAG: LON peptidase substrate-binding domain-containing protein, partial [Myxococcota bacterium]